MDANAISLISLGVAIVAVIYAVVASKRPLTVKGVSDAVNMVPRIATEISAAATTVVQGIEQVKREGELTNEQAYDMALDQMREWVKLVVPVEIKIGNDQIISAINSAILVASALTNQIIESKKVVAEIEGTTLTTLGDSFPAGERTH